MKNWENCTELSYSSRPDAGNPGAIELQSGWANQNPPFLQSRTWLKNKNRLLFHFLRSFNSMEHFLWEILCSMTPGNASEDSWVMSLWLKWCHYRPWLMTISFTQWSNKKRGYSLSKCAYLGSGGPSDSGFIDSLQRERKTRKASFWRMWENFAPGGWPGATPDSCPATKSRN